MRPQCELLCVMPHGGIYNSEKILKFMYGISNFSCVGVKESKGCISPFLIVCFTSYFVFSIAVLPYRGGGGGRGGWGVSMSHVDYKKS